MNFLRTVKRNIKKAIKYSSEGVVILMYHRIIDIPSSPYHGIVSPEHFEQHMEYISRTFHPIRLIDVQESIRHNSLPNGGVVVTFDDGYADNYDHAYPILQNYQVPATIFVTSGHVDSPREYWWDELERILLLPDHLPENVPISVFDETLTVEIRKY